MEIKELAGKHAVITGGNSGIGYATAKLLVAAGARVVITGRDKAKLGEAAATLGAGAIPVECDTTDAESLVHLAESVKSSLGTVDILFANAGISGGTPLGSTEWEAFERIIGTNLTAVFFTVQSLLPLLNEGASVVLNSSVMREVGGPGSSAYAASKAGVTSMAKAMASELAPRGIRVNTIVPGATESPIWSRGQRAGTDTVATERFFSARTLVGRFNEVDEVAKAILFLASPLSSGMTAAEIVVDGGCIGAPWGYQALRPA
ncbi:SDR family NAD(P)-dependent oxidoreductase [Roseateles sp. So40a]|uniref:SDR family NAD(P)-dependent oxidoreductase n=1 Tax=Roseateles sp. So40a TaxID=3400226 RepID=UPI003A8B6264